MFVLLGRDPVASIIVSDWAALRERIGDTEPDVIEEARVCAESMHEWACHKLGKHGKIIAARRVVAESQREREAHGAAKKHIALIALCQRAAEFIELLSVDEDLVLRSPKALAIIRELRNA